MKWNESFGKIFWYGNEHSFAHITCNQPNARERHCEETPWDDQGRCKRIIFCFFNGMRLDYSHLPFSMWTLKTVINGPQVGESMKSVHSLKWLKHKDTCSFFEASLDLISTALWRSFSWCQRPHGVGYQLVDLLTYGSKGTQQNVATTGVCKKPVNFVFHWNTFSTSHTNWLLAWSRVLLYVLLALLLP